MDMKFFAEIPVGTFFGYVLVNQGEVLFEKVNPSYASYIEDPSTKRIFNYNDLVRVVISVEDFVTIAENNDHKFGSYIFVKVSYPNPENGKAVFG